MDVEVMDAEGWLYRHFASDINRCYLNLYILWQKWEKLYGLIVISCFFVSGWILQKLTLEAIAKVRVFTGRG